MLWSSTNIKDSSCPRRGIRLRRGWQGSSWEGYRVGSYVHDTLHHKAEGWALPNPAKSGLSVLQMAQASRLLDNAAEMGLPETYPESAAFERSYLVEILNRDGETGEIEIAPSWAVRGDDWSPDTAGARTLFRLQPDARYFHPEEGPSVVCVDDYKTGLGMTADSAVASDAQVVLYAAVIGMFTHATEVAFTLWNVRWKQGQQVRKTTEEWVAEARRIWGACWLVDQVDGKDLDDDFRPEHSRCQTCPFFAESCWPADADGEPLKKGEAELYREAQWFSAKASEARAQLNTVLRQRTAVLKLADGTVLGPHKRESVRWGRGEKEQGMRVAASMLEDKGEEFSKFFRPSGDSLKSWLRDLPDDVRSSLEPHTKESSTTTYITKGADEFIASLEKEN